MAAVVEDDAGTGLRHNAIDTISQCFGAGKTKFWPLSERRARFMRSARWSRSAISVFQLFVFSIMAKLPDRKEWWVTGIRGAATTPARLLFVTVVLLFRLRPGDPRNQYAGYARFNSHRDCGKLRARKTTRFFTRTMQSLPTCIFTYLPIY